MTRRLAAIPALAILLFLICSCLTGVSSYKTVVSLPNRWFNNVLIAGNLVVTAQGGQLYVLRKTQERSFTLGEVISEEPKSIYASSTFLLYERSTLLGFDSDGVLCLQDQSKWQRVFSADLSAPSVPCFDGDTFYVGGRNGRVLESKDGTSWVDIASPTKAFINGLLWDGASLYLYTIDNIWKLDASKHWQECGSLAFPNAVYKGANRMWYEGKRYFIANPGGLYSGPSLSALVNVSASFDDQPSGFSASRAGFIAVGKSIYKSSDGVSWAKSYAVPGADKGYSLRSICTVGAGYIAVGDFRLVISSTDGASWHLVNADKTQRVEKKNVVERIPWFGRPTLTNF